jgi:hypothetical protein
MQRLATGNNLSGKPQMLQDGAHFGLEEEIVNHGDHGRLRHGRVSFRAASSRPR